MIYIKINIFNSVFNRVIKPEIEASIHCFDYWIYSSKKKDNEHAIGFRNKSDAERFRRLFSIIVLMSEVEILSWDEFKEWLRM